MPIDPRISLGVQPLQVADPMARYSQLAGIQSAQQQNELARMQMQEYERARAEEDQLRNYLGQSDLSKPEARTGLIKFGKTGLAYSKALSEQDTARTEGQIKQTKLLTDKLALLPEAYRMADTPEAYLALHQSIHADPVLGPWLKSTGATPEKGLATLQNAIETGNFDKLRMGSMQSVSQILDSMKPVTVAPSSSVYDPRTKTFVQAPAAPKEVTPTEIKRLTAERDALSPTDPNRKLYDQAIANLGSTERLAQERLNFDRSKFAWEKANPGYTIQQAEDGSIVGVNNRTLQAFPVNLNATPPPVNAPFGGGGALAPGGAGKRGGVVAPVTEPIIQPRGEPLKGKSAGLTESQGNAAMFGSAMAQAQQVLNQAEREGTTTGAGTVNLAQGIVKYVPLGVGDKLVNDIYALAVNDPTKLFGPDVNQQKVGQAQLAFAIAYLRKTSGAAFGPSEVANTIMEYFPSVGEDKAVVKQKAESRKRAIAGMKMSAGREGAKFIEQYESPSGGTSGSGASASDPLGLFPAKKP